MNIEPQVYTRRRRNVDLSGNGWNPSIGGTDQSGTDRNDSAIENHGSNSTNNYDQIPLTNREKSLIAQKQKTTKELQCHLGDSKLTFGPLGTPRNSESQKLTVYLEQELVSLMKELKKSKLIPSLGWLISQAVKKYLIENSTKK
jgi:hypothetical protein